MHQVSNNCYDFPRYYEIAFSFRDLSLEVDVIEQTIKYYSGRSVSSILELACGPSQHMLELSKRGYEFHGLDVNKNMLAYSLKKASAAGISSSFHLSSMTKFELDRRVDYAFIALGSLYVNSTLELHSHFDSVASALNPGGLYLLDWCVQFEPAKTFKESGDLWEMSQGGVKVKCSVKMKPTSNVEQLFEEQLELQIEDDEARTTLSSNSTKRAIYPQELLTLLQHRNDFEFIGWWNNWDLNQPLSAESRDIYRPITLLRRI